MLNSQDFLESTKTMPTLSTKTKTPLYQTLAFKTLSVPLLMMRTLSGYWLRDKHAKRFMILADARTGSTMLRYLLDSHPDISCDGEVISNEKEVLIKNYYVVKAVPFLDRIIRTGLFKFLKIHYCSDNASGTKAAGCKALFEQIDWVIEKEILESDISVILLTRDDRIRRALSLLRAQTADHWNIIIDQKKNYQKNQSRPVTVDYDELVAVIEENEAIEGYWRRALGEAGKGHRHWYRKRHRIEQDRISPVQRPVGLDDLFFRRPEPGPTSAARST